MKSVLAFLFLVSTLLAQNHILITEVVVTPTEGEFIEITNNSGSTIDLSDYYLTDATFAGGNAYYYNIVTGANAGGGSSTDFHARFPAGSSITAGEFQTIAINGAGFISTYGKNPTYELFETNASIPNLREALPGSIDPGSTLSNTGEVVILYTWDGQSDLVSDSDYYLWGDKVEAVDKTGVSIDGPDADNTPSTYLADVPVASQSVAANAAPHAIGESSQRLTLVEINEIASGGNGITGNNEMSEDLAQSFSVGTPNPGSGPAGGGPSGPVITNVNIVPATPGSGDKVTVSATVTDDGSVSSVDLYTSIAGAGFINTTMNISVGDTYQAEIDSQSIGTNVRYFIEATDNDALTTLTDTLSYNVSSGAEFVPISDIQNSSSYVGKQVKIQGVVVIGTGTVATTWTKAYVQDDSERGINIYRVGTPIDADLVRGNQVIITGLIEEYQASGFEGVITEITNYSAQVVNTGQPLPQPVALSTGEATDLQYEGTYVNVKGIISDMYYAGGGNNILLDDGTGEITIRVWDSAGLNMGTYGTGDTISVNGAIDIYQGTAQILLGYQEDIEKTDLTPEGDAPIITNIRHVPQSPTSADKVIISADATGTDPLSAVKLFTSFNNSTYDSTNMTLTTEVTYEATIDSQAVGTIVKYYLKAIDNQGRSTTSNTISYTVVAKPEITEIADIRNDASYIGKTVTVEAVVTIGSGVLTTGWTDTYVQDNSGRGINVYRGGTPVDPNLTRGNQVQVKGEVAEFGGILEIINYTVSVMATDQALPQATKLTTREAREVSWEGTYVLVEGVIIELYSAGGGTNIVLDDGTGATTVRAWDTANLDFSAYAVGDAVSIRGISDIYLASGQVVLAYQEDITFYELPKSVLSLKVPNKPFAPDQGEKLPITYSAGTENTHVTLRIYDIAGRLIATPIDETGRSFDQIFEWDGTDQVNEQVTLGTYILFFEVVNNTDGSTSRKTAPVVVGTVLKY